MPSTPPPSRPSPDILLKAVQHEHWGRLTIYLGAAPGVGKTYAMLEAAKRRIGEGVDVVAGIIETHDRRETAALLEGLEVLPRHQLMHGTQMIQEFDLDAALKRRPQLLLVDELAHSNAPGSRHLKRYQDIEELLAAGINIYTTINIQHLESLNDVVTRISGIRVRETVPDSIIAAADNVNLVDITPDELLRRLAEGKIYHSETAIKAQQNFFQPGNLTALRELALRQTAERVDDQLLNYMRQHAINGPWPVRERLMVCIGTDRLGLTLVREAKRLAGMLNAEWVAVVVARLGYAPVPEAGRKRRDFCIQLAKKLGAETAVLTGNDLPSTLLEYARIHNVTQIVIGRRRRPLWQRLKSRSLVSVMLRQADHVALHIITEPAVPDNVPMDTGKTSSQPTPNHQSTATAYLLTTLAVGAAVIIGQLVQSFVLLLNISIIFLVPVLFSAFKFGRVPSIYAAILSFVSYNFFFIQPLYTFSISDPHELVALFVFMLVAVFTGGLAARVKEQTEDLNRRFHATEALYDFSRRLSAAADPDEIAKTLAQHVASLSGGWGTTLLASENGELNERAHWPVEAQLDIADMAAARWTFEHDEVAGWQSATLPLVRWQFRPLRTARGITGVVGIRYSEGRAAALGENESLLISMLELSAVALERAELVKAITTAYSHAETERLRATLLSSVSHDLRTPLASILGSVTSLLELERTMDEAARRDLLHNIHEETGRMNHLVTNLLDITRLEAGALEIQTDWLDLAEVDNLAIKRASPLAGQRQFKRNLAPVLPLIKGDFVLLEQVLFNLLDNAIKYSPDKSTITIAADTDAGDLVFSITDEGQGIPAEDLERIFDKFYRLRSTSHQAGSGLGLAICRGIITALGASIKATSPVMNGRGSCFEIRFPAGALMFMTPEDAA